MSIGASIFLLVIGAILTFAVSVDSPGFNLNTVGVILMVAGLIGLLMSLFFFSSSPWRRRRVVGGTVVEEPVDRRDLPPDMP